MYSHSAFRSNRMYNRPCLYAGVQVIIGEDEDDTCSQVRNLDKEYQKLGLPINKYKT